MKEEKYYFEETLEEFYKNSNEIEIHTDIFCNKVLPLIKIPNKKPLNWLDVGIGKGEKIVRFLDCITAKVNFTYIEPSQYWWKKIEESGNLKIIKEKTQKTKGHNTTFEKYIKTEKETSFELITFIQVLYDDNIVNSLFQFILNNQNKKPYTLIINLEDQKNDLFKIRKELTKVGLKMPTSQLTCITAFFDKMNISYKTIETKEKVLFLDFNELRRNNKYWFYPFIVGVSKKKYNALNCKDKIQKIVLDYLQENKTAINNNDTTIIAQIV